MPSQVDESFYVVKRSIHLAGWDFSRGKLEGTTGQIFEPRGHGGPGEGTGGVLNRDDATGTTGWKGAAGRTSAGTTGGQRLKSRITSSFRWLGNITTNTDWREAAKKSDVPSVGESGQSWVSLRILTARMPAATRSFHMMAQASSTDG